MTIDDLRIELEQRTGVPASLLTGETTEENMAQAKALLAYKREHEQQKIKTTREQFAEWLTAQRGDDPPQDEAGAALAEIEERLRVEAGGYPKVSDAGEADPGDARSAMDQFTDWINKVTAFDPTKEGNWRSLF